MIRLVDVVPVKIGDIVKLKKTHPCGANEWEVIKTGMDIGLECKKCGRHTRLLHYDFDRRFRGYLSRNETDGAADDAG